jgi:hypothetical protein
MLFAPPPGYNTSQTNRQNVQGYNVPGQQGLNPQGYNASAPMMQPPGAQPSTGGFLPANMRGTGVVMPNFNPSPQMMAGALNPAMGALSH